MPPKLDVQSARHKPDPLWAGRVRDDGAVIEGIDKFVSGPTFMTSWVELAAELGLDAGPANDIGFDLAACHTEPHRRYHTMEHITAVLRHLDNLHAATPTAKLAAFFHDAVYDPKRTDNEAQSAELAREVLGAVERPEADDVAAIVLATAKHELPADAPRETAAFLDADIATSRTPTSVLGALRYSKVSCCETASISPPLARPTSKPPPAPTSDAKSQS